jgi:hypothetical protein
MSDWVNELENCWGAVVVSYWCEILVDEAGDNLGTQKKEDVRRWKPLQING